MPILELYFINMKICVTHSIKWELQSIKIISYYNYNTQHEAETGHLLVQFHNQKKKMKPTIFPFLLILSGVHYEILQNIQCSLIWMQIITILRLH